MFKNPFARKPEPPKPTFRESVVMLAAIVAAVIGAGTAAFKAVVMVFEIVYATPAYVRAMLTCGGSFLGSAWNFVAYVPRQVWGKLRSLIPSRAATATDTAATATDTAATATDTAATATDTAAA